jgi:(p)ppGpp synthase/HD superfamily hydrolase
MPKTTENPRLSERFNNALIFASRFHHKQIRKDENQTPYLAHLLTVSSLVLEAGGDELAAIAALLHDIVEDTECTFEMLEEYFGIEVAEIVKELSEDKSLEKSERKMKYAENILTASNRAVLISLADKLHNLRSIWSAPELLTEINKNFYWRLIQNLEKRLLNVESGYQHQEMVELFFQFW